MKSIKNNEIDKKDIGIINDNYIKLYNNSIEYLINEGGLTNDEILDFFPKEYDQRAIVTAMFLSEYK
ncbi:hypothetical protein [Myroides injenensis]|uniref:hypothetical protein n=1 Tax=Myroides injenensis TaxID=1183151 RepID=UPI0022703EB6|nr:hypothetical protein [Myroides injenensis]